MNYLRYLYYSVAKRIYSVGKIEFEKSVERRMHNFGKIKSSTRIYSDGEIFNFANNPSKITIGHNCHISGLLMIYEYGGEIRIGDHCSLSSNSRIISVKKIEIGNRVLIAHNVNIIDNISHPIDARLRHEDFLKSFTVGMQPYDLKASEIVIEDDVWIGHNVTILRGVRIGRGAIIGSDSVVTKSVEAWTVNVGNPIRKIKKLEPIIIS